MDRLLPPLVIAFLFGLVFTKLFMSLGYGLGMFLMTFCITYGIDFLLNTKSRWAFPVRLVLSAIFIILSTAFLVYYVSIPFTDPENLGSAMMIWPVIIMFLGALLILSIRVFNRSFEKPKKRK